MPKDLLARDQAAFETQWRRRDDSLMDVFITISMIKSGDLSAGQVSFGPGHH